MKTVLTFCCLLFSMFTLTQTLAMQTVVYSEKIKNGFFVDNRQPVLSDLRSHAGKIDVLAPMAYFLQAHGKITGGVDRKLLGLAKAQRIRVMPTLSDRDLTVEQSHQLLTSPVFKKQLIEAMQQLCQKNHHMGLQLDWSRWRSGDLSAFERFYVTAAKALRREGFSMSIIIYPNVVLTVKAQGFYRRIAAASRFVTLMAYRTEPKEALPEELAPIDWVNTVLQQVLKTIPANKVSLGVPVFSREWKTDRRTATVGQAKLAYQQVIDLLRSQRSHLIWDDKTACSHAVIGDQQKQNYFSVENADSFKAKLALVKRYHLRGVSMSCITREDPSIWSVL